MISIIELIAYPALILCALMFTYLIIRHSVEFYRDLVAPYEVNLPGYKFVALMVDVFIVLICVGIYHLLKYLLF